MTRRRSFIAAENCVVAGPLAEIPARDLPPGRRSAFLDITCAGNPELHGEAEPLLASQERPGSDIIERANSWRCIVPAQAVVLQVRGLGKRKTAAVVKRAERLGMTTGEYLRHLVEEDLAISERAKKSSFAELLGPGERADETEIDKLVEIARTDYHSRTGDSSCQRGQ